MRVGIIGCGLVGLKRAQAAATHGLTIVGAADPAPGRAAALLESVGAAGASGLAAAAPEDVVALRPDLMVIATPHDRLAALTLAAVEAGCHVLVEKPAARTAAELDPVIAAAGRRGRLIKVGYNHRFHPALRKAREIVDDGRLGPLMFVRGRYGHGGRLGMEREWRCVPAISGGGELIDQGSHLIDLARWFLGDFTDVQGTLATTFWDAPVEDNCFLSLRTGSGAVAWLHASWTEWKNMFSFEIYGRDGKLHIEGLGGSYGVERLSWYRMLPGLGPPETTIWEYPHPDASWSAELAELLSAMREHRRPSGDIHDARATLDIIGNLYRDHRG